MVSVPSLRKQTHRLAPTNTNEQKKKKEDAAYQSPREEEENKTKQWMKKTNCLCFHVPPKIFALSSWLDLEISLEGRILWNEVSPMYYVRFDRRLINSYGVGWAGSMNNAAQRWNPDKCNDDVAGFNKAQGKRLKKFKIQAFHSRYRQNSVSIMLANSSRKEQI